MKKTFLKAAMYFLDLIIDLELRFLTDANGPYSRFSKFV